MKLTAIILEDEEIASRRLIKQPDILFVDINVSDGNSFTLFNKVNVESKIIFTTAFDEYAVDAFRENALDYLLKPIKKEHLMEAITKAKNAVEALKEKENRYKERFLINFGRKLHNIKTEEISYIYSKDKIGYFYTKAGARIASDYRLQDLEKQLDPSEFFRANRQFIVHIESIAVIQKHDASRVKLLLQPCHGLDLVISTERTREFKKWLKR